MIIPNQTNLESGIPKRNNLESGTPKRNNLESGNPKRNNLESETPNSPPGMSYERITCMNVPHVNELADEILRYTL